MLAETEEQAWAKADAILEQAKAFEGERAAMADRPTMRARSSRSLQTRGLADCSPPRHKARGLDKRLWTGIAALTGGAGATPPGWSSTPDQVAEAMLDYYDLGITTFLVRGFDPLVDAIQYGRELLPRVRALVAARNAVAVAAE